MTDTLGDCPLCGHCESSYDDWDFIGYRPSTHGKGGSGMVRVWECVACRGQVTPDYRETGNGTVQPYRA